MIDSAYALNPNPHPHPYLTLTLILPLTLTRILTRILTLILTPTLTLTLTLTLTRVRPAPRRLAWRGWRGAGAIAHMCRAVLQHPSRRRTNLTPNPDPDQP